MPSTPNTGKQRRSKPVRGSAFMTLPHGGVAVALDQTVGALIGQDGRVR